MSEANRVIEVIQMLDQYADSHPGPLGQACRDATLLLTMLREELAETRAGYHALDKNWDSVHTAAMGAVREALDLPEATVPELVQRILELKAASATLRGDAS